MRIEDSRFSTTMLPIDDFLEPWCKTIDNDNICDRILAGRHLSVLGTKIYRQQGH